MPGGVHLLGLEVVEARRRVVADLPDGDRVAPLKLQVVVEAKREAAPVDVDVARVPLGELLRGDLGLRRPDDGLHGLIATGRLGGLVDRIRHLPLLDRPPSLTGLLYN